MEVRIGVQQSREVVLTSEQSPEEISAAVSAAQAGQTMLALEDNRGRTILVPGDKIAFVEIGAPADRRVGFAG